MPMPPKLNLDSSPSSHFSIPPLPLPIVPVQVTFDGSEVLDHMVDVLPKVLVPMPSIIPPLGNHTPDEV